MVERLTVFASVASWYRFSFLGDATGAQIPDDWRELKKINYFSFT